MSISRRQSSGPRRYYVSPPCLGPRSKPTDQKPNQIQIPTTPMIRGYIMTGDTITSGATFCPKAHITYDALANAKCPRTTASKRKERIE